MNLLTMNDQEIQNKFFNSDDNYNIYSFHTRPKIIYF